MPPQGFGNVQMGRIRGQVKQIKSPLLPKRNLLPDYLGLMNGSIVQDHKSDLPDMQGKPVQSLAHKPGIDRLGRSCLASQAALPVNQSPAIEAKAFADFHADFFTGKLVAVRMAFTAHMRLVSIAYLNQSRLCQRLCQPLQFLQGFHFAGIHQRVGLAFAAFPYPFVSAAKFFKKLWNASILMGLAPPSASQAALAKEMRWRLAFTAASTAPAPLPRLPPCSKWACVPAPVGSEALRCPWL